MKEIHYQTIRGLQNLKILAVVGNDPWPALAFTVDKQKEDQEEIAEVCAVRISVDPIPSISLLYPDLTNLQDKKIRTKASVLPSLRGSKGLVHWSECVGDLMEMKVAKPFQLFEHRDKSTMVLSSTHEHGQYGMINDACPQNVHILIPRTGEYVTWQRE